MVKQTESPVHRIDSNLLDETSKGVERMDQVKTTKTPQRIGWRLRSIRRLPWRVFSRNWGKLANTEMYPKFINTFLIWWYASGFHCNVDECEKPWPTYKTLGQFFTRFVPSKGNFFSICFYSKIFKSAFDSDVWNWDENGFFVPSLWKSGISPPRTIIDFWELSPPGRLFGPGR